MLWDFLNNFRINGSTPSPGDISRLWKPRFHQTMVLPEWHLPILSFSLFSGFWGPKPLSYWVECKLVIFAVFIKIPYFRQGKKPPFPKSTVLTTSEISLCRRAPDYSSNLCPPKIWSIWLFQGVFLGLLYKKKKGSRPKTPPKKSYRSYF